MPDDANELNAARYAKVRRMDVREFQAISNAALSYDDFDAAVDAWPDKPKTDQQ